jgi:hypothetical protein
MQKFVGKINRNVLDLGGGTGTFNNVIRKCGGIKICALDNSLKNHRVLKDDGKLFLTTPNKKSPIAKFDKLTGHHINLGKWTGHSPNHKHLFTWAEIKSLLGTCGFKIQRSMGFYPFYGFPFSSEREYKKSNDGMWIAAKKVIE